MAILQGEIQFRLSHASSAASTDPNASLGGIRTNTSIASDTTQNLFDNVSGSESAAGRVEYRCFWVYNTNGTSTLVNARIWFATLTTSPDDEVDMGLGTTAVGTSTTEPTVGTEISAPASVTFTRPLSGTPITIGDIPAGQQKAVWIRRTVNAGGGAQSGNTFSWSVEGEST